MIVGDKKKKKFKVLTRTVLAQNFLSIKYIQQGLTYWHIFPVRIEHLTDLIINFKILLPQYSNKIVTYLPCFRYLWHVWKGYFNFLGLFFILYKKKPFVLIGFHRFTSLNRRMAEYRVKEICEWEIYNERDTKICIIATKVISKWRRVNILQRIEYKGYLILEKYEKNNQWILIHYLSKLKEIAHKVNMKVGWKRRRYFSYFLD